MEQNYKHYSDLFGEQKDQDVERIENHLESMAHVFKSSKMPSERNAAISHTLQERILTQKHQKIILLHRFPIRASRRTILAAVALISAIILASTAFASMPLVNQALLWHDSRMQQVTHQQLGQTVNIAQSACGFSMIIQRIYADANDAIVAYTIKAPPTRTFIGGFNVQTATLSDADGNKYPLIEGSSTAAFANETGNVMAFDAGGTVKHPQVLKLQLIVPTITTNEQIGNISHTSAPCEVYRALKRDEVPQNLDYTKIREVTVHEPFIFDFSVPFAFGREIDLHQTSQSGGTTVTLERIVITPIETRFYVQGVTQATDFVLMNNGQTVNVSGSRSPSNGLVIYSLDTLSFSNQRGQCKVTISSRPDLAKFTPGGAPIGGPWIFYFKLP